MPPTQARVSRRRRPVVLLAGLVAAAVVVAGGWWLAGAGPAPASGTPARHAAVAGSPDFGPNVLVFSPAMPPSRIQAQVNSIAARQAGNQFGAQRYALLFEPGRYGSAADPLFLQVGYYTSVAGLGAAPGDVVINGAVDSFNTCVPVSDITGCTALDNFWRSLSNLTINLPKPRRGAPCRQTAEFWAVSQAAPMRRVVVHGVTSLEDYCSRPGYSSGGFIADSAFSGRVISGTQQQFLVRNSTLDGWSNGVWNEVFAGDVGAPAQDFGAGGHYTTLAASPVTAAEPFLSVTSGGTYRVFVPAVRHDSAGPSWAGGRAPGRAIPVSRFFIATPGDPARVINAALARGQDLILTPGVYQLDQSIEVNRPDTVVLGLGWATLVPAGGVVAMRVAGVPGVKLSGLLFSAGPVNSPVLLQLGRQPGRDTADPADPTLVQDVFFRIGGAGPGRATTSLVVDSSQVIIDDVWAWRADHGDDVGWTDNVADTGVVVNGADVTAYGLAVEHYEKDEVIWTGAGGTDIFFQNEMPYDPPSQAAWMASPATDGYPAFTLTAAAAGFHGYGMGSYSFFDKHVAIYASSAFETADPPGSELRDLFTICLNSAGSGGIEHVVDGTGPASTITNPDTPAEVVSYP